MISGASTRLGARLPGNPGHVVYRSGLSALPLESPLEVTMVASRNDRRPFLGGTPPSDNYSRGLQSGELMYFPGVFQREGSMQEQVDAILDWNGKLLGAADLTLEDVVEVRVYMTDRGDYEGDE